MPVRYKRRSKRSVITKEYGLVGDWNRYFDIAKIDEDQHLVYGIVTKATMDNQDEIVDWNATKEAIEDFKKWRNLREMHKDDVAVGTIADIEIDEENQVVKVCAKVVDDNAWKKVKEGVYKGFSIGGKALKRVKEFVPAVGKVVSKVLKYVLNEISLVDRPAHPECVFTMIKRDANYNDPLISEMASTKRKLGVFKDRILTDDAISKLRDRDFGLVKKVRMRSGSVLRKRYFAMPDRVHAQAVLNILDHSDLSKREKFIVHENAMRKLGKRHDKNRCPYCSEIQKYLSFHEEDVELAKRRRQGMSKLAKARQLLREATEEGEYDPEEEDFEVNAPGGGQVESENLRPARQKSDFEGKMRPEFTGAEAGEGEFIPDEQYYEPYDEEDDEEFEGEIRPDVEYYDGEPYDEEDYEGWRGDIGFEEGLKDRETRTHDWDTEAGHREKKRPLDREDPEGEYPEEHYDDEDEEDQEGTCPYCGVTIKQALKSGTFRKGGSIQCPGCNSIYDFNSVATTQIGRRGVAKRQADVPDEEMELIGEELAKRDGLIDALVDRVETLEGMLTKSGTRPNQRKYRVKKAVDDEEDADIRKQDTELKADVQKATTLRKAQQSGQQLTGAEQAFCEETLNKMLDKKVTS